VPTLFKYLSVEQNWRRTKERKLGYTEVKATSFISKDIMQELYQSENYCSNLPRYLCIPFRFPLKTRLKCIQLCGWIWRNYFWARCNIST